jgi:hypothetical protein
MGISGLLLLNVAYLALGVGLCCWLRTARSWCELASQLGLAYLGGLCVATLLVAELAVVDVTVGVPALSALAGVVLLSGLRRFRSERVTETEPRLWGSRLIGIAALAQTGLLLAVAGTAFAVRPLSEWDGWAIWGFKARALYGFGGVSNPAFESHVYAHHMQDYPLFLPALEATAYRALGSVDEQLVHVQLLGLAVGFAGALWALLRPRVPAELLGLILLAIVAAPGLLDGLAANYADVPLAIFVALGMAALARWLIDPDARMLPWAALFLASAMLTKNEGAIFAAAAVAAALVVARRRLPVLAVGACAFAPLIPWRVFVAVHRLHDQALRGSDFRPSALAHHTHRIAPAASRLVRELLFADHGLLIALALVGAFAALTAGRGRLIAFAGSWFTLAFAGLVLAYWASPLQLDWYLATSAPRIVLPLIVGAAALAPLFAGDAWRLALRDLRTPAFVLQNGWYTSTSMPTPTSTAPSKSDGSA